MRLAVCPCSSIPIANGPTRDGATRTPKSKIGMARPWSPTPQTTICSPAPADGLNPQDPRTLAGGLAPYLLDLPQTSPGAPVCTHPKLATPIPPQRQKKRHALTSPFVIHMARKIHSEVQHYKFIHDAINNYESTIHFDAIEQLSRALEETLQDDTWSIAQVLQKDYDLSLRRLFKTHLRDSKAITALNCLEASHARILGDKLTARIEKTCKLMSTPNVDRLDMASAPITTDNNSIEILFGRSYLYEGIIPLITNAQNHVHMIMSEYDDGIYSRALSKLMMKRSKEGITIRVVFCQAATRALPHTSIYQQITDMRHAGVEVRIQPFYAGFEHRKLLIADGTVALMGGGTIIDENMCSEAFAKQHNDSTQETDLNGFPCVPQKDSERYLDMLMRIQGDSVAVTQCAFLQNWRRLAAYHQNTPLAAIDKSRYFPSQPYAGHTRMTMFTTIPWGPNEAHPALLQMLSEATETIDLEFPYLLLGDMIQLCENKSQSGIATKLLIPSKPSSSNDELLFSAMRTHDEHMLKHGVEICKYTGDKQHGGPGQGYNHAKVAVVDLHTERPKLWTSTGNPEPLLSGGKEGGGRIYDLSTIIELDDQETIEALRQQIALHRDANHASPVTMQQINARTHWQCIKDWSIRQVIDLLYPDARIPQSPTQLRGTPSSTVGTQSMTPGRFDLLS